MGFQVSFTEEGFLLMLCSNAHGCIISGNIGRLWAQKNNSKDNQVITFTKNKRKFCLIKRNIHKAQSDILVKERNPAIYIQNKIWQTYGLGPDQKTQSSEDKQAHGTEPLKAQKWEERKKGSRPWDFICNIDVMSCSLVPRGSSNG